MKPCTPDVPNLDVGQTPAILSLWGTSFCERTASIPAVSHSRSESVFHPGTLPLDACWSPFQKVLELRIAFLSFPKSPP